MLFPYKYTPHKMEKMQKFVQYIFYNVWCKAPAEEYGMHLYEHEKDLYKIMEELNRLDLSGNLADGAASRFYAGVNEIYNEFKLLNGDDIKTYSKWFYENNNIEKLCVGIKKITPRTYSSLNNNKTSLNNKIENFFKNIYSSGFFDLKIVKDNIGSNLQDYYKHFVQCNNNDVCPFCGLMPIDGEFDPTRDAFDHYLPKSKYPFNSVNLKNLAPSCGKCNLYNKKDQDPLHDKDGNRRKAFYPFSETQPDIKITITIRNRNWTNLMPQDMAVGLVSNSHSDEIDTWNELFRINDRYAARCCSKSGGAGWLNRVFNECSNYNLTPKAMLQAEVKSASTAPWQDSNFLKKAFLEECDQIGLVT